MVIRLNVVLLNVAAPCLLSAPHRFLLSVRRKSYQSVSGSEVE
jgi:hypothetical protein